MSKPILPGGHLLGLHDALIYELHYKE